MPRHNHGLRGLKPQHQPCAADEILRQIRCRARQPPQHASRGLGAVRRRRSRPGHACAVGCGETGRAWYSATNACIGRSARDKPTLNNDQVHATVWRGARDTNPSNLPKRQPDAALHWSCLPRPVATHASVATSQAAGSSSPSRGQCCFLQGAGSTRQAPREHATPPASRLRAHTPDHAPPLGPPQRHAYVHQPPPATHTQQ